VTLLALSGCSGSYEQYVLRYRLTLTLVVDGKELTGSVVQALRYSRSPTVLPDERPTQIRVMGQALTLELPNRDEVMLLLFSNRGYEDDIMGCIYGAFGQTSSISPFPPTEQNAKLLKGSCQFVPERIPMVIHSMNILDRNSFEEVDPTNPNDTLGSGVSVKSLTLTLTTELVTTGLRSKMQWLDEQTPPANRDIATYTGIKLIDVRSKLGKVQLGGSEFWIGAFE
jgi:hypothetical protein